MPTISIGFVPRDRFCKAPESLASILEHTAEPFHLLLVDPGIPSRFRGPLEGLIMDRTGVTVVTADPSVSSNAARNLVLDRAETDFVCLIENDCIVQPGWLSRLVEACEEHPADCAAPLLLEPRGAADKVHFDDRLGRIRRRADGRVEILPRSTSLETDRTASRKTIDFVEMHCLLFRTSVFERIGRFDEAQHGSRAEVDLSLALWADGVTAVLAPDSRVTFSAPPPVYPDEREHYLHYWDLNAAAADHRTIEQRWKLIECPSAIGFVKARRSILDEPDPELQVRLLDEQLALLDLTAAELSGVIPAGERLILADEAQWVAEDVAPGRTVVPFTEHNGQYWGPPADDAAAIRELERLRTAGASFIAFGWPTFWWLAHYPVFKGYVADRFPLLLESERLVVFDLREVGTAH